MTNKRFFELDFDEIFYIFDNEKIPKDKVIDNEYFDDFDLSLSCSEIVDKLNELYDESVEKSLEIIELKNENEKLKKLLLTSDFIEKKINIEIK